MHPFLSYSEKKEINALVAFADITLFTKTCQKLTDIEVAHWMEEYFEITHRVIRDHGGLVVKFIGDAALIVFEEEKVDQGIAALLQLKSEIDSWLVAQSLPSRLEVQAHFGSMVAGPMGPKENLKFDILGKTVNTAATLNAKPFAISPQAFRKLSPKMRSEFKKHTPAITYIRTTDRHPS